MERYGVVGVCLL